MLVYISGAITSDPNYKEKFADAEKKLHKLGYKVLNPCMIYEELDYEQHMHIDFAMIDVCDVVYLLEDWETSTGAIRERYHAIEKNKIVYTSEMNNLAKVKM